MKIRPVGADLLHADGRTDVKKVIVPFRNFTKAPKKVKVVSVHSMKTSEESTISFTH
jgi:hypothetical protein